MSEIDVVEIQRQALQLGPWVNAFEYKGMLFPLRDSSRGGTVPPPRGGHTGTFFQMFPDARRILELGSLEGADTVRLARRPHTSVVAVEGRAENVARARFVVDLQELSNVTLLHADVETFDLASLGRFDAVLCTGLLYHLQRPWDLLATLSMMTDKLLLWTHYWGGDDTTVDERGYVTKIVHEDHPEPRTRALSRTVRWLDRPSLFRTLLDAGFGQVIVLNEQSTGPVCGLLAACRRSSGDHR